MKTERHLQNILPAASRNDPVRGRSGSRIRTVLAIVGAAVLFAISYRLYYFFADFGGALGAVLGVCLFVVAIFVAASRVLKNPAASLFLLSVESEASKISWLTWSELKRSAIVVLCCMIAFSLYLFCCDMTWHLLLNFLSILKIAS